MTTWLITGCSSGLGRALAEAVLGRGDSVVATARDASTLAPLIAAHPDTVLTLDLDVTDAGRVAEVVSAAERRFGAVDVLVNNAGYGYRAAVEEGDPGDVARLFATNVFGPVELIRAVLPGMRERRRGTIVNVSSIGARMTPPGSGYYAATKAALEALSGALREEVAPLGITTMIVEPGAFRTDFAGRSLAQSARVIPDYAATAGRRRRENDTTHGTQPGDPGRAAAAMITAVTSPEPPFLLLLGEDALRGFDDHERRLRGDVHAWRETALGTSYPE
ncbi:oxidoreductase [Nocardiopsis synnemataformans]|uniref:oxidoreductase n=1 Tax=Nocardiopsis synnemataformans TaxID=61305 RepID=UPI003EBF3102